MKFFEMNKKSVIQAVFGILLSRVVAFSLNPMAIAFFAAAYVENQQRNLLITAVAIGICTSMSGTDIVKYGLVLFVIVVFNWLAEKKGKKLSGVMLGGVGAATSLALTISEGIASMDYKEYFLMGALEAILIIAVTNVFQWGIRYLYYGRTGQAQSNEEIISVVLLVTLALRGIPEFAGDSFSIMTTIVYLFVLFMGHKYGAGAGAIAGTSVGISICVSGGGTTAIAILCILGISAGMLRELGRFGSGLTFLATGIALSVLLKENGMEVEEIRSLISSVLIFFVLPRSILKRIDSYDTISKDSILIPQSYQTITKNKLNEFSQSFQKLSNSFYQTANLRLQLNRKDMLGLFDDLSQRVCSDCTKCAICWEQHYYDTYHGAISLLRSADRNGIIESEDVSIDFAARCIRFEEFVRETNQSMEYAKLNLGWNNKLAESRAAVAGQLGEVAKIIEEFAVDLCEVREIPLKQEKELLAVLRAGNVQVKRLSMIEKRGKKLEVSITLKTKRNTCVTAKDIATLIGNVIGKRWKPEESSKTIVPKEYETLIFVEDTNFKVLTGMARIAKSGEKISGDNFSFLHLSTGEMIMVLADGMGTGIAAYEESESVIELLENLLEAGFREESSIRLINSVLTLQTDKHTFSTVDMSIMNLHTGLCEFVKNGASATFIKREDWIETISSSTLPVGMINEVESEGAIKKLYDGDIIVMVTDGVTDCFPGEDKEFYVENILMNITSNNPQEIANQVLQKALEQCGEENFDDMSVMVAGIWEKA